MGLKQTALKTYTFIRLTYTRLRDWNRRRVKLAEERLRKKQVEELERLSCESELLEAQLRTIQAQNEVDEERRRLRRTD